MNTKQKIAKKLREIAHKLDKQPYTVANGRGWTIHTAEGMSIANISDGRSIG